ncbi:hypothetical protein C8R44DRAFT_877960 [Mycena epipterygia]|nr:hypothetical protein C8R44DRAFT_877960 [Mycena epipterygia]
MAFISNSDSFTLGDGIYNNVHGNIVHNIFYGRKRRREEIDGKCQSCFTSAIFYSARIDGSDIALSHHTSRRRRLEEEDGIKAIRIESLKLTHEIGSGPGYFLHAGQNKGRAVIVKVFNAGPPASVREMKQLESTVAISKRLMHPNVLRIEGISSAASLTHFIAYEGVHWKNVEGPLAAALKDDLMRSITLGFKMIAGLSSAMNHLRVQGISLAPLEVENFDVFLDVGDRFLISINPQMAPKPGFAHFEESEDDRSWDLFDGLCQKVLRSANRVLHTEPIDRNPVTLELLHQPSIPQNPVQSALASLESHDSARPQKNMPEEQLPVPPRRELPWSDGQRSHRCAGYVREEITLAPTTVDSAIVLHDAPSPLEICSVCHEIVGFDEAFQCVCSDFNPGSRHTVKCQTCKFWSHSDCVGNPKEFICERWSNRAINNEFAAIQPHVVNMIKHELSMGDKNEFLLTIQDKLFKQMQQQPDDHNGSSPDRKHVRRSPMEQQIPSAVMASHQHPVRKRREMSEAEWQEFVKSVGVELASPAGLEIMGRTHNQQPQEIALNSAALRQLELMGLAHNQQSQNGPVNFAHRMQQVALNGQPDMGQPSQ